MIQSALIRCFSLLTLALTLAGMHAQVSEPDTFPAALNVLGLTPASTQQQWIDTYEKEHRQTQDLSTRKVSAAGSQQLSEIVNTVQIYQPESFAAHYLAYLDQFPQDQSFERLKKAQQAEPDNALIFDDMMFLGVVSQDKSVTAQYAQKLLNSGVFSEAVLEYARNVLHSMPDGSVVVTYGFDDTFPIWIAQYVSGIKPNVKVVPVDLLGNPKYAQRICSLLGVEKVSFADMDAKKRIDHLLNSSYPYLYLALTVDGGILKKAQKKLYLTGLALHHLPDGIENVSTLVYNWENQFEKNHLNSNEGIIRNYQLIYAVLEDYYEYSGNAASLERIRSRMRNMKSKLSKTKSSSPATH
ncbi:MAG: hypothetical protein KDC12_12610 [Flavobacteriales bacterium]|nr:hypothetical protein [Flavobacteriales bacterium]